MPMAALRKGIRVTAGISVVLLSLSAARGADPAPADSTPQVSSSKETREKMATLHEQMAACLRSSRSGNRQIVIAVTALRQDARVRVLAHIKKLDDAFGQFLVRVTCRCGAVREIPTTTGISSCMPPAAYNSLVVSPPSF